MRHLLCAAALLASCLSVAPARAAETRGVTDHEIRIGASAVLSGPLGPQTTAYGEGSRMVFDAVNAAGGVHGRRIVYKTLDDAFDVERAVANTRQLIEQDKVFLIYNNSGTAHTAAILPLAAETRTVVFGPVTGATALRQTTHRHLFHVRAGYADEAMRIVRQLRGIGIRSIATFHQDDAFGKSLLGEVRKAAQAEGLTLLAEAVVDPKQPDFAAAAAAVAKASPQAVVMCTAGGTFTNFIKALQGTSARPAIYGFSVVGVDQVTRELDAQSRGIVLAQIMPSLANRSNPLVKEYLDLVARRGQQAAPSTTVFEGFVHARVLVEALRRAGRALSTDALVQALESGEEFAFGKFAVRYTPHSHAGAPFVDLAIISNDGKLRY